MKNAQEQTTVTEEVTTNETLGDIKVNIDNKKKVAKVVLKVLGYAGAAFGCMVVGFALGRNSVDSEVVAEAAAETIVDSVK